MTKKRIISILCLLIISFGLIFGAISNAQDIQYYNNQLTYISNEKVYSKNKNATKNIISDLRYENKKSEAIFWTQLEESIISSAALETHIKTPIIAVCGSLNTVDPSLDIETITENECVLGAETASSLFGSTNVNGLIVTYNEKNYLIKDVSTHLSDCFIYLPNESDVVYDRFSIRLDDVEQRYSLSNKYKSQIPLGETIDYSFFILISEMSIAFFFTAIIIFAFVTIYKSLRRIKSIQNYSILFLPILFLIAFSIWIIIDITLIHYPIEMIPTKWSDFDFYGDLILQKKSSIELVLSEKMYLIDMVFFTTFGHAFVYANIANTILLLTLIAIDVGGLKNGKDTAERNL